VVLTFITGFCLLACTYLFTLFTCIYFIRLKERKSSNFKPGSSTVSALKTSIENQSTDNLKTLEDINQSNGIGNPDISKKRKLNDVVYVPTLADFPSYKLLDHNKCKNLLNQETFFIDGFTPEVRDTVYCFNFTLIFNFKLF
jgi:hypothetical protein